MQCDSWFLQTVRVEHVSEVRCACEGVRNRASVKVDMGVVLSAVIIECEEYCASVEAAALEWSGTLDAATLQVFVLVLWSLEEVTSQRLFESFFFSSDASPIDLCSLFNGISV